MKLWVCGFFHVALTVELFFSVSLTLRSLNVQHSLSTNCAKTYTTCRAKLRILSLSRLIMFFFLVCAILSLFLCFISHWIWKMNEVCAILFLLLPSFHNSLTTDEWRCVSPLSHFFFFYLFLCFVKFTKMGTITW